jgi:bile acid:Na+ symporter, BASS family
MSQFILLPVIMLMVSTGMSLDRGQILANWRRQSWAAWLRLLGATFILPPALVLVLYRILPLGREAGIGLLLVAVAPGAPLLTRNIANKGFDLQRAASYQLWSASMTPLMIPLVVAAVGKLYARDIWIPPMLLLRQIALKQFLPLLAGAMLMALAPALARKTQQALNTLGNLLLIALIVLLLVKMGPALERVGPWVPIAALVLAAGSWGVAWLLMNDDPVARQTLAVCNVNRHVGLALLLATQNLRVENALPSVACYALAAALLMTTYARFSKPALVTR